MLLRFKAVLLVLLLGCIAGRLLWMTATDGFRVGRLGMLEPRPEAANDAEKIMLASGYYQETNLILVLGFVSMLAAVAVRVWWLIRVDCEQSKPETLRSFLECLRKS